MGCFNLYDVSSRKMIMIHVYKKQSLSLLGTHHMNSLQWKQIADNEQLLSADADMLSDNFTFSYFKKFSTLSLFTPNCTKG